MNAILANWKTTTAGVVLLLIAVLQMAGVDLPGISHVDLGQAISAALAGLGLIVAKDAHTQ